MENKMTVKRIASLAACLLVTLMAVTVLANQSKTGNESVEVAPTKAACCQNIKDRAKAAAAKACHPEPVQSLNVADCVATKNKTLKDHFDCKASWTAVCGEKQAAEKDKEEEDPCASVTCSVNCTCVSAGSVAVCQCKEGYGPDPATGTACVSTDQFIEKLEALVGEGQP